MKWDPKKISQEDLALDLQLYGSAFIRFTLEGFERIDPRDLLPTAEAFSDKCLFDLDPRSKHAGSKKPN